MNFFERQDKARSKTTLFLTLFLAGIVFTVPHWTWASHQAMSAEADLFLVTDRQLYGASLPKG